MGIEVKVMKIASLMQPGLTDFEERRRAQQRKEMGEAYKKTANFVEVSKNPMLAVLENLLSGKTEKDLLATDVQSSDETLGFDEGLNQKNETQIKSEDMEHERLLIGEDSNISISAANGKHYMNSDEVKTNSSVNASQEDTINILEQIKQAALAPAQPSEQDLRIAASASAQIQQTEALLSGETVDIAEIPEPFAGEDLTVNIPDRFMNDFKRDANAPTVFGQELESLLFQRTFNKVVEKYKAHIAMVKNGYRSMSEPSFSKIA